MQSSGCMRVVPPRKTLRDGQRKVVDRITEVSSGVLPVQLPTGYGKTLTAAASFRSLWERGQVNRLLYLVPTRAQLDQFCNDGSDDFLDAGLSGVTPFNIGYSDSLAVKHHRKNTRAVFAATIQAVASGAVGTAVRDMMQTGVWMVVVDEYHHYGIERAWGRAVASLPAKFLLAMSATPERKDQDSPFGKPVIKVPYKTAVAEGAAKRLILHSYEYRVDAITVNGEPISFTTSDVVREVGSCDPAAIDRYVVDRKLRWSPKYISPLVSIPVERLLTRRGSYPLQMIVGAMGCLHAKMVCEQIRSMFGDLLRVDWVGTGPHGRTDAENSAVISKFCPPKREGKRHPGDVKLDVLVHVGMAGEGLDSVFVSEVVHLNSASVTNQNHQENGRASRPIPGAPESLRLAYINVDSSSPYAEWSGRKVEEIFDAESDCPPPEDLDTEEEKDPRDITELPDEPMIMIAECELQHIDKGDPEVRSCAEALTSAEAFRIGGKPDRSWINDPDHEIWQAAIELRRKELRDRASNVEGMAVMAQLRATLDTAVGSVAARAARIGSGARFERSLIGDMKKRINTEMRKRWGARKNFDESELRERYRWVKALERTLISEGLPTWLQ